jgi:hypothetical protein
MVLVGCGGGGGGGSGISATTSEFTNWSNVRPNSTVILEGVSQTAEYTADLSPEKVTSLNISAPLGGTTASASYDSNRTLSAVTINPADADSVSWSLANGDSFFGLDGNSRLVAVVSRDGRREAIAADAFPLGWEYQTFGTWATGLNTGSGTVGNFSVGSPTLGASVPVSGTATYSGFTGGRYVDPAGTPFLTTSGLNATVDFAARTINFSTSVTELYSNASTFHSSDFGLDLDGVLSYSAGSNQISGSVTTDDSTMSGNVAGRFFGPSAQEMGGTFLLEQSGGGAVYTGAFGAER